MEQTVTQTSQGTLSVKNSFGLRHSLAPIHILLLITTFLSLLTVAAAQASGAKTKEESELHLNISETAFAKIIKNHSYVATKMIRTDVYFDSHDGREFTLRRNLEKAKLRIQKREDSFAIQKSWLILANSLNSQGFDWVLSKRMSSSLKHALQSPLQERITSATQVLSSAVSQNGISPEQRNFLESLWSVFQWPTLADFDEATQNWPLTFVPAAVVKKERWLIPLQVSGHEESPLLIQLGRDTDVLGMGQPQSFEVEVELKQNFTDSADEVAEAVTSWLRHNGIVASDTQMLPKIDFFRRLEALYP